MSLIIEAMGMSSPLGPLIPACAAFRAGVRQARESRDFHYFPDYGLTPQPLTVCALPSATFGFGGVGRLVAVACEMFQDLRGRLDFERLDRHTAIFLALPDPLELGVPMTEELERLEPQRLASLGQRILSITLQNLGLEWHGGPWRFFSGGHTAFARALLAAREYLAGSSDRSCLVGAVDSLLDRKVLERLLLERRLKTEDNPVGLTPGEAGAILFLRPPSTRRRHASAPAMLHGVGIDSAAEDAPNDGRALANCARLVLESQVEPPGELVLVTDHDGEQARAQEWGMLQVHLRTRWPALNVNDSWFPSASFGSVRTTSGALHACLAARSLERGYAPARSFLLLSTSDSGERAATLLSSPN